MFAKTPNFPVRLIMFLVFKSVSVSIFDKEKEFADEKAKIYYTRLDEFWKKEQKYEFLSEKIR